MPQPETCSLERILSLLLTLGIQASRPFSPDGIAFSWRHLFLHGNQQPATGNFQPTTCFVETISLRRGWWTELRCDSVCPRSGHLAYGQFQGPRKIPTPLRWAAEARLATSSRSARTATNPSQRMLSTKRPNPPTSGSCPCQRASQFYHVPTPRHVPGEYNRQPTWGRSKKNAPNHRGNNRK